jgi:hypothetical protein
LSRPKTYRERLRGLLHKRLTQVSELVPIQLEDGTLVTVPPKDWKNKFRERFAPGESTERMPEQRLHQFILFIESECADRFGIEWPERTPQA